MRAHTTTATALTTLLATLNYGADARSTKELHLPRDLDMSMMSAPVMARSSNTTNTVDDPTASTSSNMLTTTFVGGTGQAGNMFDILAITDVTVTSLDIHMLSNTENVTVYYKIGRYAGYENDAEAWTVCFDDVAEGQGNGQSTGLDEASFTPVAIAAGNYRAFYVTLTTANLRYSMGTGTVGSIVSSNNDLQILEGIGNAYPAFTHTVSGRVWNGSVRYILGLDPSKLPPPSVEEPGATFNPALYDKISSTMMGGSGQAGNMFDVVATSAVTICHMDVHTLWDTEEFILFGKVGSYSSYEVKSEAWTQLGAGSIEGQGINTATTLPSNSFDPITIAAGETYAFYVTLTRPNLRYTVAVEGASPIIASNSDLQLLQGSGNTYPAFGTFVQDRIWNGALYYSVVTPEPTSAPSLSPSIAPSNPVDPCHELHEHGPGGHKSDIEGLVSFDYEVVTKNWADLVVVLEMIEERIVEGVVPVIMGCATSGSRALRGVTRSLHEQGIVGASQDPLDELDVDQACLKSNDSVIAGEEVCSAIKGAMTMYIADDHLDDVEVIIEMTLEEIKNQMDAGAYVDDTIGLSMVSFIGTRVDEGVPDDMDVGGIVSDNGSAEKEDDDDKGLSVVGSLFTSAAVVACVAAVVTALVLYRRMTNNVRDDEYEDDSQADDFSQNKWDVDVQSADFSRASRVSFDQDNGKQRAVRFTEVNGQIVGRFDSGSFDDGDQFVMPDPASPSRRNVTMDVHRCNSAACDKCTQSKANSTKFLPATGFDPTWEVS
uniref:Uncharacterized protein n=1 Tax=Leptocylindrus danicus TaxID=163516 RepID=A0A7S2LSU7_9STRA|eukprot:CAMPEP_0116003438 /NCGR_PEP_ID=MMETSP0321-20121206/56_1 /TAXON_ID=163516 /ORGANISM="Leptocylindrus danicus var. danicus, Strain B650" /LENGTH=771 /DNA_ID=CAMNT_0003471647 /DNA_START=83 /DNA_END=2398 /DNA_ORIENTATION=+